MKFYVGCKQSETGLVSRKRLEVLAG